MNEMSLMQWEKMLTVIGAHAEGEVGRVITGGVLDVPGGTMLEKLAYLREHDELRQFANHEPRGCAQMTTNLLLPPCTPGADAAFIPMQADASHAMSGSNAMCVTTVLLETGILPMQEPETVVRLDTAAGLITATARCNNGKVESVSLEFVPSYAAHLKAPLEVEGLDTLTVDVAYGGVFYVLPRARDLGFQIAPDVAQDMVELSYRIKAAARQQLPVTHPEVSAFNSIDFVMFTDEVDADRRIFKNATIMPPGRVDRSPCGTGTAARLAVMHAKKELSVGDEVEMQSTIGSSFKASALRETRIGSTPAIEALISGRSWLYATMQLGVDPTDPFMTGYTLADTWGKGIEREV